MRFQHDLELEPAGFPNRVAQMGVGRISFQVDIRVVEGVLIGKRIEGYPLRPNLVFKVVERILRAF